MSDTPETVTVIIPSSESDRKRIRGQIEEMVVSLDYISSQREQMKAIAVACHEEFGLPKKMINKMARTLYKQNRDPAARSKEQCEQEDFDVLYETITNPPIK